MSKIDDVLNEVRELNRQFGKIDERTANIWSLTEKQEAHLAKLNDAILTHAIKISSNSTSIKWIIRILVASGILGGCATGIINLVN